MTTPHQPPPDDDPTRPAGLDHPAPAAVDTPVRRRRLHPLVLAGVAATVVAAIAAGLALSQRQTQLAAAYAACVDEEATGVWLDDEDHTLELDAKGDDDIVGVDYVTVACVLEDLDVPSRTTSLIDSTRALDGRQTDRWDVFTATWSYHPDSGLELLLVEE